MNSLEYIEIKIKDVSPQDFDISDLMELLKNAENMLYPNEKKNRPTISYEVKEGSTRNLIRTLAGPVLALNTILNQINKEKSIDFIDPIQAKAIENIQLWSVKKGQNILIKTSLPNTANVEVNRKTQYYRSENIWIDSDLYIYGKITNMGGKTDPNLHLDTDDWGTIIIKTDEDVLANLKENHMYKYVGVHVQAKQNIKTSQLDNKAINFIEFVDYENTYDENYLNNLISQASKSWKDVPDTDKWLAEIRGI